MVLPAPLSTVGRVYGSGAGDNTSVGYASDPMAVGNMSDLISLAGWRGHSSFSVSDSLFISPSAGVGDYW